MVNYKYKNKGKKNLDSCDSDGVARTLVDEGDAKGAF